MSRLPNGPRLADLAQAMPPGAVQRGDGLRAMHEAEAGGALTDLLRASHSGYVQGYSEGFAAGEREGATSQPRRNLFTGACWGAAVATVALGSLFGMKG